MTFQYEGLNHLKLYRILTIEAWLKHNFDWRYLELRIACMFSSVFIVLNIRDEIKFNYPSSSFLCIVHFFLKLQPTKQLQHQATIFLNL